MFALCLVSNGFSISLKLKSSSGNGGGGGGGLGGGDITFLEGRLFIGGGGGGGGIDGLLERMGLVSAKEGI